MSKLFSGIVIGAVLGVLFAPDKGSETRKKIAKSGEDFCDSVMDKINDLTDFVNRNMTGVKNSMNDTFGKGTESQSQKSEEMRQSFS